jgi:large subunit ribosomal protein L10
MPPQWKLDKVKELTEKFREHQNIFLTDFTGLGVEEFTDLRRKLRGVEAQYQVAKNRLILRAAKEVGYDFLEEHLAGPTGLVFVSEDPNVPAKILLDFYKSGEKPKLKAFLLEGRFYTAFDDFKTLANLPAREELLARLVLGVEAPIGNLIANIQSLFRQLVSTVEAVASAKKEGE